MVGSVRFQSSEGWRKVLHEERLGRHVSQFYVNEFFLRTVESGRDSKLLWHLLFERQADPNFENALHLAVRSRSLSNVILICIAGADIDKVDESGRTAIELARSKVLEVEESSGSQDYEVIAKHIESMGAGRRSR